MKRSPLCCILHDRQGAMKFILYLIQIHFVIWTNPFCNLDKYILQFGQIRFPPPHAKKGHFVVCSLTDG